LRLYLRVSGSDGNVIKLVNVGPMISFSNPEPRLDKQSRLHLLYQSGAKTFEYLVVSPAGDIEIRQTHEYAETRPRLRLDESGDFKIAGGVRVPRANDLPVVDDEGVVKDDKGTEQKP
jgi:hypothetical protein